MTTAQAARPSGVRRLFGWLYRRPRVQLVALLAAPVGWFGIVYFGSLAILFAFAFWSLDPQTGLVLKQFTLANFQRMIDQPVYQTIVLRTVTVAAVVTVVDAIIAFPIAYYMARVASPRRRALLFISVLLPLWASYLVKVFAWRVILAPSGVLDWVGPAVRPGPGQRRLRDLRPVDDHRVHLHLAAVHDPADLRRDWSGSRAPTSRRRPTSVGAAP